VERFGLAVTVLIQVLSLGRGVVVHDVFCVRRWCRLGFVLVVPAKREREGTDMFHSRRF